MLDASGLTREQLWRARSRGGMTSGIHYVRVGRRLMWHQDNVLQWLKQLDLTQSGPTTGNKPRDGEAPQDS